MNPGDEVLIKARVIRGINLEDQHIAPAYKSVQLQTEDGQSIWTNVSNLIPIEKEAPEKKAAEPVEDKAVKPDRNKETDGKKPFFQKSEKGA